ncbi:hypothetical protein CLU79DRAFT_710219 [Phycomyces nitens]|nr:hypothetical protein CLU79DRAFT_710219 [Phycomyces nitens]
MSDQYAKVMETVHTDPKKAYKYAENGQLLCNRLIKKYDAIAEGRRSVTPIEEPNEVEATKTDLKVNLNNDEGLLLDWEFIAEFKKRKIGRMNWKACYAMGIKRGRFQAYINEQSLKNRYNNTHKNKN